MSKKQNAVEDYLTTPISVLIYITDLERQLEEAVEFIEEMLVTGKFNSPYMRDFEKRIEQLKETG